MKKVDPNYLRGVNPPNGAAAILAGTVNEMMDILNGLIWDVDSLRKEVIKLRGDKPCDMKDVVQDETK